jgi:4-hydroxybenzoate polyprenyltransferase
MTEIRDQRIGAGSRIVAHARMMRLDHSIKQLFVAPGIVLAVWIGGVHLTTAIWVRILIGLVSVTLIASSFYVLNELLDAPRIAYTFPRSAP